MKFGIIGIVLVFTALLNAYGNEKNARGSALAALGIPSVARTTTVVGIMKSASPATNLIVVKQDGTNRLITLRGFLPTGIPAGHPVKVTHVGGTLKTIVRF